MSEREKVVSIRRKEKKYKLKEKFVAHRMRDQASQAWFKPYQITTRLGLVPVCAFHMCHFHFSKNNIVSKLAYE